MHFLCIFFLRRTNNFKHLDLSFNYLEDLIMYHFSTFCYNL